MDINGNKTKQLCNNDIQMESQKEHGNDVQTIALNFLKQDFIMEPSVFDELKKYFKAGGQSDFMIDRLSQNYIASAQMVNSLTDLLVVAGMDAAKVHAIIENNLKRMLVNCFDPKKADSIFTVEGDAPSWVTKLIEHKTWRDMIYQLADEHSDCILLNFIIKLISDAGFQSEITSMSTASQQMEVFSPVFKSCLTKMLSSKGEEEFMKSVKEVAKMVCFGQHTYLFSQILIQVLSQEAKGRLKMRRIGQEIHQYALKKRLNVSQMTLALYKNIKVKYPQAYESLSSMLSKNCLNPADVSVLYRCYLDTSVALSINIIRNPQFLDLLVDAIFKSASKINQEHKYKYIYLLAYAVSVTETTPRKNKPSHHVVDKEQLEATIQAIQKAHSICNSNKCSTDLISEIQTLYGCIVYPVVGVGLIRWIEATVSEPSYFKLCTESTPTHLAVLDEIANLHPSLHEAILKLLIQLFESKQNQLEILVELELKRVLLDRMIHLLTCDCVIPVVKYIKERCAKGDTDVSLIRYFIMEVLESIDQPYSIEFVNVFLPLVEDDEITSHLSDEEYYPFTEFIMQANMLCK